MHYKRIVATGVPGGPGSSLERHGHSPRAGHSGEYIAWCAMRRRCCDPRNKDYKYYGARGVSVCARWSVSFTAFLEDMGARPTGMSIDRIDNDGNYEPGNCRWATALQQSRNRRKYSIDSKSHRCAKIVVVDGISNTIAEWSRETGINEATIGGRLKAGWPPSVAISAKIWHRELGK